MTRCYTRFSSPLLKDWFSLKEPEAAWSESVTGAYNTVV
jgi:hypothetical protein